MRKILLSALLASGLTLAGAGAYALEDQPQEPQTQEQMDQGTEIEQDACHEILIFSVLKTEYSWILTDSKNI